jgi:hypothetical protein
MKVAMVEPIFAHIPDSALLPFLCLLVMIPIMVAPAAGNMFV